MQQETEFKMVALERDPSRYMANHPIKLIKRFGDEKAHLKNSLCNFSAIFCCLADVKFIRCALLHKVS